LKPKFSVVIPLFNSAPFIGEAISSVAAQTCRDLEVICVDDGSTDNSISLAQSALQEFGLVGSVVPRPSSVRKGAGASRNYGVSLAGGEIVAFLDSDDVWLSEHLERALAAFDKCGAEVGVYCAMGKTFMTTGEIVGVTPGAGFPEVGVQDALPILLRGMITPVPALCVRKSSFAKTQGFSETLKCYEDWWLVLQLARVTKFFFNSEFDCLVRVRGESASRETLGRSDVLVMSSAMYRDQFGIYSAFRKSQDFSQQDRAALRQYVEEWNSRQISDLVCAGRFSEANRIVSALLNAPSDTRGLLASVLSKVAADVLARTSRKSLRLLRGAS
jgi:glycosyltransferase involved in cell wall biosynthesis